MSEKEKEMPDAIVLYNNPEGRPLIDVRLDEDTVWLSQAQMSTLFEKDLRTVSEHLRNVFKEGELAESAVVRKFRITAFWSNSLELKMFFNCSLIVRTSTSNSSAISFWVSQIFSSSYRISKLVSTSPTEAI